MQFDSLVRSKVTHTGNLRLLKDDLMTRIALFIKGRKMLGFIIIILHRPFKWRLNFLCNLIFIPCLIDGSNQYVYFNCYCGMYIPLSDDKHRFVRDSSKSALEIQDNVQHSFLLTIFFLTKKFFSRTGFCLGLHTAVVFRMQSFNLSIFGASFERPGN